MHTLLIAESDDALAAALLAQLENDFRVHRCADGDQALVALAQLQPEVMILDLSLPRLDGLSVLERAEHIPPVILGLANVITPYVQQATAESGIGYTMMIPCAAPAVANRLKEMVRIHLQEELPADPQRIVARHMDYLKLPRNRKGYRQLMVGVPLFAQDPALSLHKELYPAILERCGGENTDQVESTIRAMIHDTWKKHTAIWKEYFPGYDEPPSNGDVLRVLTAKLQKETLPD